MNKPKILIFDIEITPIEAFSWGPKWETNLVDIDEHSRVLSYSAKWLGGKHITKGWPDYKGYKPGVKDDKAIVKDIWNLLDETDILIVQNGKAFDTKTVQARFSYYDLGKPSPYQIVDTLLESRKAFKLPSYSLDDICNYYGLGRKKEHEGFALWKKCMTGDPAAWGRMLKYNKHDVVLTEKLYLKVRPFMKSHPNLGLYMGKKVCPYCGSAHLQSRGYTMNSTTKYRRFQCQHCKGWSRDRLNIRESEVFTNA